MENRNHWKFSGKTRKILISTLLPQFVPIREQAYMYVCVCVSDSNRWKAHDEVNCLRCLTLCISLKFNRRNLHDLWLLRNKNKLHSEQNFHFELIKTVDSFILRICCMNVRPKFQIVKKIWWYKQDRWKSSVFFLPHSVVLWKAMTSNTLHKPRISIEIVWIMGDSLPRKTGWNL